MLTGPRLIFHHCQLPAEPLAGGLQFEVICLIQNPEI